MDIRNARFTADGHSIDCEINHPTLGWIPFTASPDDPEAFGKDVYATIVAAGGIAPYEAPAVDLTAYAAAKRFEVETGGVTVNGATVDTSRESQAMITGAYTYSQAHPDETINFKAASGWVTLDAATLAAIATAVGSHVQSCFAAEASVAAEIAAGTITTTAEIDAFFTSAVAI